MITDLSAIAAGVTLGALQTQSLLDPLDNRVLLCHALGLSRVSLITQSERELDAEQAARFAALVQRRLAGEPVAYIVGQREFFGLPFEVNGAVLIPRPDTELLVELTLDRLPPQGRVLDMGTGSGAIAVALAHTRRDAAVTALDVSPDALAVARRNAAANGVQVNFLQSDWYAALQGQPPFDVIASNPPYIASGDRHLSEGDLRYEPPGALTDHADGLSALRIIVAGAAEHLKPQGWLLMEHGYDQAAAVRQLLTDQGYNEVQSWADLAGIERVTGARAR
ncbi:peptide chain release factor N(5)-glutamine methyltransferase [Duganella sp. BJB488]|uniref:peptide chain release factor N(5)-glutamine methyltransferase n=1 Tax=unclassified Duganella TaxID=2636909 RepID=UPI000E342E9D|nr:MULTISPECIES: peptide chain release factor N(5)-glutamine methyltransferase [unclassified Duganella]RFP24335.1 peptide chain release factor N(5)-glutamine methyltransferase [Duganella sp. BJB489]RFP26696.1 peptide chain release factor N(5)-glutamine methyltransferase [Duganella sp. BJB488]RFP34572.1 peptide chain release factor N(5)-glutamine methyltransferase [Duganella sp. BJB480]